jgi:hypothetical protein
LPPAHRQTLWQSANEKLFLIGCSFFNSPFHEVTTLKKSAYSNGLIFFSAA